MNYGFVIDNRSCIGCHACSTACKSENEVALGVHRTWVKTVETGRFPDSRRHFQVSRCNHCANPPCVSICPTGAMYQRTDGIVEFDSSVCIGCKGCMQACPYDAVHIDPDTGTAAKCHYCAHRVEVGREPACVVVCPEHAIIAGDMDDPKSEISQVLAKERVTVRKPEKGTLPKLFYIEGEAIALNPNALTVDRGMLATERATGNDLQQLPNSPHGRPPGQSGRAPGGASVGGGQQQGLPGTGPIMLGEGRMADQMVQMAYNVQHKVPWHWQVPAYLVTKGISTGLFLLIGAAFFLGIDLAPALSLGAAIVAMTMLALTGLFLILDLERPERFYLILLRPQWRSWLTRGAVVITLYGGVLAAWLGLEVGRASGLFESETVNSLLPWVFGLGLPVALMGAIYTAFLFHQAEGRDLWQSRLLPFHLVVQSLFAGASMILLVGLVTDLSPVVTSLSQGTLGVVLMLDLFLLLVGESGMIQASEAAAQAAHEITRGRYATMYWGGAIALGHVLPLALVFFGSGLAIAGICAIVGLYFYEHAFVMAPQNIPNS